MDLIRAGAKRCLDLNEMEELRNDAYINSKVAKQRMKRWHDQLISNKEFRKGQRVLLYDSRLHIFPGKLKSRWIGPFIIHQVHLNGVVELLNSNSTDTFKVNGHRLKPFIEPFKQENEEINLLEPRKPNQKRSPRETLVQGSIPEPPQPLVVPLPVEDAPLSHPSRLYETRRPPTTPRASSTQAKKSEPQPSQTPAIESQISSGMTPEVVIRRPMVTQPPIEARAQGFLPSAAEVPYEALDDSQGFFLSPYSIGLLSVHDYPPRPGSYCHPLHHRRTSWYSGARHIAEACTFPTSQPPRGLSSLDSSFPERHSSYSVQRGIHMPVSVEEELPPSMFFIDALLRHNIFPLQHWVQRRGVLLEALFRISEGFFFGPHHLIMAALLYFEEKEEPQLERIRICREIFTLDKWTSMTAYGAEPGAPVGPEHPEIPHPEQPEEPQPTPLLFHLHRAPPSSEPRIAISISEYRGLCHTLQALTTSQSILTQQMTALRAHQEQIIHSDQHTAILRQIQHHLGILSTPEHPIPILSEPRAITQAPPRRADYAPEEPTTGETEASTPSIRPL
ncbi:hypothetical protein CK203_115853 [Vitis vinifera]|uniref:Uncharacterized protein n=1 Tax=Vitis vinifera TaxID=29760 RepID=A0A438FCY8_VITVI|nr:hypothetical protein CK203_115853 [Vitis vinifera]